MTMPMPSSMPDQNPAHSPPEIPINPDPEPEIVPTPSPEPEIQEPAQDPGTPFDPGEPDITPGSTPPEISPPTYG